MMRFDDEGTLIEDHGYALISVGPSRRVTVRPARERVARTFVNQAHPMIDEIAGFSRIEIDPRTEWPDDPQPRPARSSRLRSMLAAIVSRR